jgi:hypothetical protein
LAGNGQMHFVLLQKNGYLFKTVVWQVLLQRLQWMFSF